MVSVAPTHSIPVGPPQQPISQTSLSALKHQLLHRARAAADAAQTAPAIARPSVENCRMCAVRHLCTEYWKPKTQQLLADEVEASSGRIDRVVDFELNLRTRQSADD